MRERERKANGVCVLYCLMEDDSETDCERIGMLNVLKRSS
jgi:hypothetical protein